MLDFSICIPTYNSEKTINTTLESINSQNFDKQNIEVLILDGGSTDKTLEIAKSYSFVKIFNNEKKLPEFAKMKGINLATGKYFIKMDSDESFAHNQVLTQRKKAFEEYPKVNILIADKLLYVKGFGVSGTYLNICGDPFTWFIYRNKHGVLSTFQNNIRQRLFDNKLTVNELCFAPNDKRPIADGGTTTYRLDFVKENFGDKLNDIQFVNALSDKLFDVSNSCLCINDDNVYHRSKSNLLLYLKKIKFRIINNVFAPNEAGFSTRKISNTKKKYLFPLYAVSFIFPLIDSIKLALQYKDISMLLHLIYTYYAAFTIAFYMLLKIAGVKKTNKEY